MIGARIISIWTALALVAVSFVACSSDPDRQQPGPRVGVLSCRSVPGTRENWIIRSSVDVLCVFRNSGIEECYTGETGVGLGVDINWRRVEELSFAVFSATTDTRPGSYSLAGRYLGAKASVTAVQGIGAAGLIGAGGKGVSLQPLGFEQSSGAGVAAGLAYLELNRPANERACWN